MREIPPDGINYAIADTEGQAPEESSEPKGIPCPLNHPLPGGKLLPELLDLAHHQLNGLAHQRDKVLDRFKPLDKLLNDLRRREIDPNRQYHAVVNAGGHQPEEPAKVRYLPGGCYYAPPAGEEAAEVLDCPHHLVDDITHLGDHLGDFFQA